MAFFLIVVGILLIVFNLKAIRKEKNSFKDIVKRREDEITDFDVVIGELRREFSETILELQQEIYSLNKKLNQPLKSTKEQDKDEREFIIEKTLIEEKFIDNEKQKMEEEEVQINSSSTEESNVKVKEIGELLKQGISLDDICEKYNIGKGEVLLIKELYLR